MLDIGDMVNMHIYISKDENKTIYINFKMHLMLFFCFDNTAYFTILTTVMILSFRTDMPGQTVQTQIRLLLEEQSDQGLHCLPFRLHSLDSLLYCRAT